MIKNTQNFVFFNYFKIKSAIYLFSYYILSGLKRGGAKKRELLCAFLFFHFISLIACSQNNYVTLKIAVHGVEQYHFSIIPLSAKSTNKPLKTLPQNNKQSVVVDIEAQYCPGEFLLQFSMNDANNQLVRKEHSVFIDNQNISIEVNPWFINNPDSIVFISGGDENKLYNRVEKQLQLNKDAVNLLLAVLVMYDNNKSPFYEQTIKEYRQRIKENNELITNTIKENKTLFVSSLFRFYEISEIDDYKNEGNRKKQQIDQYLNTFDFKDKLVLQSSVFRKWLDNYVGLYLDQYQTKNERDIILAKAGETVLTKAQHGNTAVFSWIIDYFFEGYESMNMPSGIKMLERYIENPSYLSSRKEQIKTRIKGIETLNAGMLAPDITVESIKGDKFQFQKYQTDKPYKMLLFWSADCEHCVETIGQLYPWYSNTSAKDFFDIIAISLDNTETEIPKWKQIIKTLPQWLHSRAQGGLQSEQAKKYYVVSTPVMILVDSKTNKIIAIPDHYKEIELYLK